MKNSRILAGALLAGGLWSATAFAQVPPPAPVPAPAAAAAAAAKPGFCEKLAACCDRVKRKLCGAPIGQMLNSITKPLTAATGGIIPGFCPAKPSDEELKKPGAAGAAAQALKDAVEAKERRAAVRILGTFDCHWYPEAEAGLTAALRTDRSECVRLEAAIALNRGCCCTRLIVAALEDCVGNGDKFGPTENSPRVQAIAMMALDRCLQCPDANLIVEDPLEEKLEERREERQGENIGPGSRDSARPGQTDGAATAAADARSDSRPDARARGEGFGQADAPSNRACPPNACCRQGAHGEFPRSGSLPAFGTAQPRRHRELCRVWQFAFAVRSHPGVRDGSAAARRADDGRQFGQQLIRR